MSYQINVYYRSNYDWSLKYTKNTKKLVWAKFSDCLPLRCFMLSEDGEFEILDFKMEYQNSLINNNFSCDNGAVAVLAGNKIKLTPLRYVNMPPPMSLQEIQVNNSPPFVINWWKNYLFVLSNGTIEIIHSDNLKNFKLIKKYSNINEIETESLKSFIFIKYAKDLDPEAAQSYYETEGFLIMNKAIQDNDKTDEVVIILIKLKVNFKKKIAEEDYIEFGEITKIFKRKFDKMLFLFNSTFSQNLFEKKCYNDKLSELQMLALSSLGNTQADANNKQASAQQKQKGSSKAKKIENDDKEDIFAKLQKTDIEQLDIGNYNEDDNFNNSFDEKYEEDNVFSMLGVKAKHPEFTHPHHQPGHLYKHAGKYSIYLYAVICGKNKEKEISKIRIVLDLDLFSQNYNQLLNKFDASAADEEKILKFEFEHDSIITTQYDIVKAHAVILKAIDNSSATLDSKISLEEKVVYLTRNNRLYLNNTYLAADTTSFEIFKNFLIFTQTSNSPYNILHILDLSNPELVISFKQQMNKNDAIFVPNFDYKHFSMRTLERTSLIVAVTKNNLIVQLSRGNLETFYPRLLVLDSVLDSVSSRNYIEAFELVRKNKINPNFLYDIDPEGFFASIDLFIKQVQKVI